MAQEALDHPDVDALLEQVGGEAVAQGVDGHRLVEPSSLNRLAAGTLHRADRDRAGRVRPREQPGARAGAAPVGAQDHEQLRREHDIEVAPALALADVHGHPGAVDVGDLEADHLGDAQARGLDRGQQRPHPQVGDGGQQASDLLAGENGGQWIDTLNGAHLWAERFDGTLTDVFELQDRVAEGVVGAIEPRLRRAEIERARRKPTESLDAYDLYLRALPHVSTTTPEDNREAVRLLDQALALDPGYAVASGLKAWCHAHSHMRGWAGDDDAERVAGERAAR
jgi:hypothetical protein